MLLKITTIVFLLALLALFYITPGKIRRYVLLLGSVVFVFFEGGLQALVVLAIITAFTYICGLLMGAKPLDEHGNNSRGSYESARKTFSIIGIAILVAVLFLWKYIPYLINLLGIGLASDAAQEAASDASASASSISWLLTMPVGLSFYTFQAISYIADVYTGKLTEPEKNPFDFALYMMWFPKWMSGPIERCGAFIEQIEASARMKFFSMDNVDRFVRCMTYLIWGLFMKLVIADRIGAVVDTVYADIPAHGFLVVMLASVLYTLQIYCDFAGYTNSMIGISSLFGIELTQNFVTPYLAENTVEFWRRWHISLSNFLRDYIYIPLGGNRKGAGRKRLNTLAVFFVCGMWHGAGLSFIVWGLLHGLFNILTDTAKKAKASALISGVSGRIITFCLVSFAWIFFRAADLGEALRFIAGMVPGVNHVPALAGFELEARAADIARPWIDGRIVLGISVMEWWIAVIALVVLTVLDIVAYRAKAIVPEIIYNKWHTFPRAAFLVLIAFIVLVFGKYGSGEDIRAFMYMAF